MELDNLKRSLLALKAQNAATAQIPVTVPTTPLVTPITPTGPTTVVSNPVNVSQSSPTGTAIDVVECEAGYYPYGGICFPCKTGYWNGTNCIENKNTEPTTVTVTPQTNQNASSSVIQVPENAE